MSETSFDVARNIRMTQDLQCRMLRLVSDFFTAMQENAAKAEQTEILADLEIVLLLMASRLGISKETLTRKAVMAVKAELLQEKQSAWESDLLQVLQMLEQA